MFELDILDFRYTAPMCRGRLSPVDAHTVETSHGKITIDNRHYNLRHIEFFATLK